MHKFLLVLVFTLKVCSTFAATKENEEDLESLPTTISADFMSDSFQTKTTSIFGDISIPHQNRLILGFTKSVTAGDLTGYDPSGATIGWGSDPLETWIYGATLNTWGIPEQITANSISGSVKYAAENWDLQMVPRFRRIVGYLTLPKRDFAIMNTSLTVTYDLYFLKNWKWMVSLESDSYGDKLNRLQANIDKITALSANIGRMMQSFNYYLFTTGISYQFKKWSPSLELQSGKSAISESRFSSSIAKVYYRFNDKFSGEISAGATTDLDGTTGTSQFIGLSLTFTL